MALVLGPVVGVGGLGEVVRAGPLVVRADVAVAPTAPVLVGTPAHAAAATALATAVAVVPVPTAIPSAVPVPAHVGLIHWH